MSRATGVRQASKMVATFIVEEITQTGRRVSQKLSNGLKKIEPFVGGRKVTKPFDKLQNVTIRAGICKCILMPFKTFLF